MRQLRTIRIFLTTLFLAASIIYLAIGPHVQPMAQISETAQIVLSATPVAIGALVVWMLVTYFFGRLYCSSVCPIGTISSLAAGLRRKRKYSYRPGRHWTIHILLAYLICIIAGISVVTFLIQPWDMMRNIAAIVRPSAVQATWISYGLGSGIGIIAGILSLTILVGWSIWRGREYCAEFCPYGIALGLLHPHYVYRIEIDPDRCTSCGRCEEACPASCIKVSERTVDNARCVRCFDCTAVCPDDAIRFQNYSNRAATPLMNKVN